MNCLEFRQRSLANPSDETPELVVHRQNCPSCKRFFEELNTREQNLTQAITVPVPPRLAERVMLNTSLRKPRWQPYAIVASLLLVVSIVSTSIWRTHYSTTAAWSEVVLAHVLNERDTLQREATVAEADLANALAQFGLHLTNNLGVVRYLDKCNMPGGKGLHVVLSTPNAGLVTLIIPPRGTQAEYGSSQREGFASTLTHVSGIPVGIVTDNAAQMLSLYQWLESGLSAT